MQQEIVAAHPSLSVRIGGVNLIGLEQGNPDMVAGRTLFWLQETAQQPVWTDWHANWRDVMILDSNNRLVGVYNLTDHPLEQPANYAALKSMILSFANR